MKLMRLFCRSLHRNRRPNLSIPLETQTPAFDFPCGAVQRPLPSSLVDRVKRTT